MAKTKKPKKEGWVTVTFEAPEQLKVAFHQTVLANGEKMGHVLCDAMEKYVKCANNIDKKG